MVSPPFDAVLVVSFGGPLGVDDVRPFLANVLRGRRVAAARVEAVVEHYLHFEGISPITRWTFLQAAGLSARLARSGPALPVYVGMRNWQPFLHETLAEMARDGVRRAVAFVTAAHRSYASCGQYKQNVADARAHLKRLGLPDVEVQFVGDWHLDDGFVSANAMNLAAALKKLPEGLAAEAEVLFTAHSIPTAMAANSQYVANLEACAAAVMRRLDRGLRARLVYQSRSGRPEDPWLEPDVLVALSEAQARGCKAVVLAPIGFVSDHVEVLHDLDHEAAAHAEALGLRMVRASTVNDHPLFLDLMADKVRECWARRAERVRLPIVSGAPSQPEGLPLSAPAVTWLKGRVDRVAVASIAVGQVVHRGAGC